MDATSIYGGISQYVTGTGVDHSGKTHRLDLGNWQSDSKNSEIKRRQKNTFDNR